MTRLSEALAPLAARMPRGVRDIEILRVAAQLDGDDFGAATEQARRAVLAWAKKRAGGPLPPEAWEMRDFDLPRGGRNSSAVRIETDDTDLWALRAEDPDKDVAGRVWSTEVVIGGKLGERPHVSLRLITSTNEADFQIEPHVPGLVLQLIDGPGLVRGGRVLGSIPRAIESENAAEDLCDHLEDPERRLPLFVVTMPEGVSDRTLIADEVIAKATAGIARVVRVPADMTWILTRRFGRFRSVFGGAVRVYMPGFSPSDDPYRHRLFLAEHVASEEGSAACADWLRKTAADLSVANTRLGRSVLDFTMVRTASRRLRTDRVRESEAPEAELLETARELVDSLEKQVEEKDKEIDGYIEVAEAAEARAQEAERENRALLYQVRQLKDVLARGGDTPTTEPPIPQEWPEFLDWLDQTYPDRIALTPAARRMVRTPEFEDVALVARCVSWLASEHYDRRLEGGGTLRDAAVEGGIRNALCGGDEYEAEWNGRRHVVDWHLKNGGNVRDPKRCLRIYYFWEPDTQRTVIDHLPAHRRTGAT